MLQEEAWFLGVEVGEGVVVVVVRVIRVLIKNDDPMIRSSLYQAARVFF